MNFMSYRAYSTKYIIGMRNIKLPFYYTLLSGLIGAALAFFVFKMDWGVEKSLANSTLIVKEDNTNNCKLKTDRLSGYKLIRPLLFVDQDCESVAMESLKEHVQAIIETKKQGGKLISASVYVKSVNTNNWTAVNADEKYHPASLNKVPILISYLHTSEKQAGLLNQTFTYKKSNFQFPNQYYKSKELKDGQSYSVKELLRYMICYSDNAATTLLWSHLNFDEYKKTFTNLGMQTPSFKFDEMELTAMEYSNFFKVLYNATYLSRDASEFCFSLLTTTDFKDGLLKSLPSSVTVAHKFGECDYDVVKSPGEMPYAKFNELHDAGIVFLGNRAYYVTIMTKGTDTPYLSDVIGELSLSIFNDMNKLNAL